MMIDATLTPQVGFISLFGTAVCNVNHSNVGGEPLPGAEAKYKRTLEAVGSTTLFSHAPGREPGPDTVVPDTLSCSFLPESTFLEPSKAAPNEKLFHVGMVCAFHGNSSDFKPVLLCQLTHLCCIIIGHEKIAC